MRKFAISDIHGCVETFKSLLGLINFSKEDELYLLGDYIDRGPDSKGVIDHIWYLQQEGYTVHCLRGNHEEMLLGEYENSTFHYHGLYETLQSFGVKAVRDIPDPYIEWIKALPCYFEVDNYILVHAGLDFLEDDPLTDLTSMLWIRHWYEDIDRDWLQDRMVIHGHTPMKKELISQQFRLLPQLRALDIDAGCVFPRNGLGYLCTFELTQQEITFTKQQDFQELL
jgi:serine/threonine protein phosphatase 1